MQLNKKRNLFYTSFKILLIWNGHDLSSHLVCFSVQNYVKHNYNEKQNKYFAVFLTSASGNTNMSGQACFFKSIFNFF